MFHRQFYVRHTVWYKWKSCRTCQSFAWFVWQVLQLTTTYTVNAFNGTIFLIIQLLRLCSTGMEWSHLSRAMTKPTMWLWAQQRLRSAWAFWSEPSLSTWRKLGSLATHWVHSEDSDQTGRMPRLIWVFAGRTLILLVLSCRGSFQFLSFIMFFCCCFYWDFTARHNYLTSFEQVGGKWKILKKNNLPTRKQILASPSWAQTHSSELMIDSER